VDQKVVRKKKAVMAANDKNWLCVAGLAVSGGIMLGYLLGKQCSEPRVDSTIVIRLHPGQDLESELVEFVRRNKFRACTVVSCVGSVQGATLRLANATALNRNEVMTREERFEIVSLVGTLECDGLNEVSKHLHISLADKDGRVWGGHVISGVDSSPADGRTSTLPIFTTAEVTIIVHSNLIFTREHDPATGFPELCVKSL
jgi:predicted DNA-binding protein with PD1-like motif